MKKNILIDTTEERINVALLEDNRLAEYFTAGLSCSGNIYLGKVDNMIKGNKTAFIDIGMEKNALLSCEDGEKYSPGSLIVVQAVREPIGDKGAKVVSDITLQGSLAVLTPRSSVIGVSKKIEDPSLRESLKTQADELLPEGMGCIIRTEAANAASEDIAEELKALLCLWNEILKNSCNSLKPALLHSPGSDLFRYIKEKTSSEEECQISVNDKVLFDELSRQYGSIVQYSDSGSQLFGLYRIDRDLKQAVQRRVWLKNGAFIVFDRTEALTVIDVNSGKSTGAGASALKVNLEASEEIVRQIRLRNIAGIIIIDFINMDNKNDENTLLKYLSDEFKKDSSPTCIYGFTRLGLMELSRKRIGRPLSEQLG